MTEATDWGIVVCSAGASNRRGTSIATLRDGVAVTLRRLADTDLDSVVALADYLSDDERYLRFFTVHPCGMAEWAQSLTKPAPGLVALGAFDHGELVGVAHDGPTRERALAGTGRNRCSSRPRPARSWSWNCAAGRTRSDSATTRSATPGGRRTRRELRHAPRHHRLPHTGHPAPRRLGVVCGRRLGRSPIRCAGRTIARRLHERSHRMQCAPATMSVNAASPGSW